MSLYSLLKPMIFAMDAEKAHSMAIHALRSGLVPKTHVKQYDSLASEVFGLKFASPVGLAAGFDKNADAWRGLLEQGFGFVEVGTITPRPQEGNPTPRLFRLIEDNAVINRMGFNNGGMDATYENLRGREVGGSAGIIGINIGKNKDTERAEDDYTALIRKFADVADYFTVNISSPNTKGLRDLQSKEALTALMQAVMRERDAFAARRVPVLVKIAPDLDDEGQEDAAAVAVELGFDGMIVSNTTITRPDSLRSAHKGEQGGLSGAPLMQRSTQVLRNIYRLTGGKIPLIGVGGIGSAEDAIAKIRAGASLVQLYSMLVYEGLELVARINDGLADHLKREGMSSVNELVGIDQR
jgi:dihydroorotate dehydrogenase